MMLSVAALVGCTSSAEEMLVGRWQMERAFEKMAVEGEAEPVIQEIPGFDNVILEFFEGDECMMTDRTDTMFYRWSLTGGSTLVLFRDGWAEDYKVNVLTKERLVYSDTYTHYDSVSGLNTSYLYRYEYNKI